VHEITLHHDIETSADHFWDAFIDPGFTRKLIVDGLGFARCDIGEVEEKDGKLHREMFVEPKLDLPGPVAKLLGPKLGYTETANLDREAGVWTFVLRLSVLSERIRMGGKMTIEPRSDKLCHRVTELWTDVRIFGLGGLVEKAAEKNLRDGWGNAAVWMNEYFAREAKD
jgi:hypothetical protein